MKRLMKHVCMAGVPMFAALALLFSAGLMMVSCGDDAEEAIDNFNSEVACGDFCTKRFECENHDPTDEETDECVSTCRNSIENNCGNEHQEAANDKIEECVDQDCGSFWVCMVFEAAPECFGFVTP